MRRLFTTPKLFVGLLFSFTITLGLGWISQSPSFEELHGGIFRGADYFHGIKSTETWAWWSPNFLGGHSLAMLSVALLPLGFFHGIAHLLSPWLSAITTFKLIGVSMIFCGGLGAFHLTRRLGGSNTQAALAGLFYATSAQFAMRVAMLEHLTTAACMALTPIVLVAFLRCEERASWRNILGLAASMAALALCYTKIFLLFIPFTGLFLTWRWLTLEPCARRGLVKGCLLAALITLPLGLLPLLPAVRESGFLAGFALDPFDGWQRHFSFWTALAWVDYGNSLSGDIFFTVRHPAVDFYLGLVVLLGILLPIAGRRQTATIASGHSLHRFFAVGFLFATWLSSGPKGILQSHAFFLKQASNIPDPSIAIGWLLLLVQPVLIYRLLAPTPRRPLLGGLLIAAYLLIPGFKLLELIPFYGDIRAPNATWTAFGALCAIMAASQGWASWWKGEVSLVAPRYCGAKVRMGVVVVVLLLWLADIVFLHKAFFREGLPRKTYDDFAQTQEFLAKSPTPGAVFFLSGRYFYLATPAESGRPLANEALLRHFQLRWARHMETNLVQSPALMRSYCEVFGISHIVIDRADAYLDAALARAFESEFPAIYRNDSFLVLENKGSLAPGFYSPRAYRAQPDAFLNGSRLLTAAQDGRIGIEAEALSLPTAESTEAGPAFAHLRLREPRATNYHRFTLTGLSDDADGWVVVTEKWHPDWTAFQDGRALPVRRALGALISVQVKGANPVDFIFAAPPWYSACMWISASAWVLILALLGGTALPGLPKVWLNPLNAEALPSRKVVGKPIASRPRRRISKALVVIPTYNESESLPETLAKALASDPRVEVLIVDDNSPDGTADMVRRHAEFGQRVHLLARPGKLGLGTAYKDAFQWALQRDYDACVEMDADLSHDPADIPRLLDALDNGHDAAIGSRYLNGVRVMNWPQHRLLLSTFASSYVRLCTGLPLTDATSGFKALRLTTLADLDWQKFRADGYGFQIELHYFLWQQGASLTEVPIIFTERREGQTKMSLGIAAEALFRVLQLGVTGSRSPGVGRKFPES